MVRGNRGSHSGHEVSLVTAATENVENVLPDMHFLRVGVHGGSFFLSTGFLLSEF